MTILLTDDDLARHRKHIRALFSMLRVAAKGFPHVMSVIQHDQDSLEGAMRGWERLQDDISAILDGCEECDRHGLYLPTDDGACPACMRSDGVDGDGVEDTERDEAAHDTADRSADEDYEQAAETKARLG